MIIKGNSRGGASQLGRHLLRTDTNERIEILELQSPVEDLTETFRDWQLLSTGTQGKKGLYHVNIDPDTRYTMTPEQWQRSVDVLEKELGFTGQPRAIVLHEKNGRAHVHVVWQRTDIDTMTLKTDSHNYAAHERASMALEQEFGHEHVPGKHAKRDREKQPEFPRSETTHEEWQQSQRTRIDPKEFKAMIQQLHQQSDNAQAFKTALEEQGFILASGDRGYTLVDEHGGIYNLVRQLKEKKAQVEQFMAAIPLSGLPTVEEAKALQREARQQEPPTAEPDKPAEPQPHKPTPEQIAKIEQALKERHDREGRELTYRQQEELKRTRQIADEDRAEKLEALRALQKAERDILNRKEPEYSDKWIINFYETIRGRWNPHLAEQRRQQREQEKQDLRTRQRIERQTLTDTLKQQRDQERDDLKARHQHKQQEHTDRYPADLKRYIEEEELSNRLLEKLEQERRQEELDRKPDEPDPPKPSL